VRLRSRPSWVPRRGGARRSAGCAWGRRLTPRREPLSGSALGFSRRHIRLGLLIRDASGKLRQATAVVSTGPETRGMHIRNYHAEMMRRATAAMELIPAAERDISSLTLCVGQAGLGLIKRRIQELRRELLALTESEPDPVQVVQVNFQLFPLSETLTKERARSAEFSIGVNPKDDDEREI
jgi:hypothetical protein